MISHLQHQKQEGIGKTQETEIQGQQPKNHSHSSVSIKGRLLKLGKASASTLLMVPQMK